MKLTNKYYRAGIQWQSHLNNHLFSWSNLKHGGNNVQQALPKSEKIYRSMKFQHKPQTQYFYITLNFTNTVKPRYNAPSNNWQLLQTFIPWSRIAWKQWWRDSRFPVTWRILENTPKSHNSVPSRHNFPCW